MKINKAAVVNYSCSVRESIELELILFRFLFHVFHLFEENSSKKSIEAEEEGEAGPCTTSWALPSAQLQVNSWTLHHLLGPALT